MGGIGTLKRKTKAFRKKVAEKTKVRLKKNRPFDDDAKNQRFDDDATKSLLFNSKNSRRVKAAWEEDDKILSLVPTRSTEGENSMNSLAAATAFISSSFDDSAKSADAATRSSHSSNYHHSDSPTATKVIHPVICKRDIFIGDGKKKEKESASNKETRPSRDPSQTIINILNRPDPDAKKGSDMTEKVKEMDQELKEMDQEPLGLPRYSISGSMLASNLENGKLKSTAASKTEFSKLMSPPKPRGLPPNTIMASMLFRTMEHDNTDPSITKKLKAEAAKPVKTEDLVEDNDDDDDLDEDSLFNFVNEEEEESDDDEEYYKAPFANIHETTSRDSGDSRAQSTVSSVTMYSAHHTDPVVRASSNLLDILRSNNFQEFYQKSESYARNLYEA